MTALHFGFFFSVFCIVQVQVEGFFHSPLSNADYTLQSTRLLAVKSIESTPNPLSFKLSLDQSILSGSGQTFLTAYQADCPEAIKIILATLGMESVYAMPDWVCVNKLPSSTYSWDELLPLCVEALGGSVPGSDASNSLNRLIISKQQSQESSSSTVVDDQVCITIRVQSSNGIPIQVEASDGLTTKRQALSPRFASTMESFISRNDGKSEEKCEGKGEGKGSTGNKAGNKMKFFEGRSWVPRGALYAATLDDALAAAVDDMEVVYSDDRLSMLASGVSKEPMIEFLDVYSVNDKIALRAVEQLSSFADSLRTTPPTGTSQSSAKSALMTLTDFVETGTGSLSARRMAIAYLGSCSSESYPSYLPYKDAVFSCLSRAFSQERSPGMRRTAGDALSDLGDDRAIPIAIDQLRRDPSKLVRWRAARILGELAGVSTSVEGRSVTSSAVMALRAASVVEGQSFEVVFESMSSLSLLVKTDGDKDKEQSISMREFLKSSKSKE